MQCNCNTLQHYRYCTNFQKCRGLQAKMPSPISSNQTPLKTALTVWTYWHCNTLQHTAAHCNALQHVATRCNTLQRTATHVKPGSFTDCPHGIDSLQHIVPHCNSATHSNALWRAATHVNLDSFKDHPRCVDALQLAVTHCNTMQHTAT